MYLKLSELRLEFKIHPVTMNHDSIGTLPAQAKINSSYAGKYGESSLHFFVKQVALPTKQ